MSHRYSDSFVFTHIPNSLDSIAKLERLKAEVKSANKMNPSNKKRVVLQGRLGLHNKNAHLYSAYCPRHLSASTGGHSHQRIKKDHAAYFDVYVYTR